MALFCPDLVTTQRLAQALAHQAFPETVLLLQGDLGSGKTTFTQAFGQALGIREPITSPTFILVQEYYGGRLPLFHCDCYRLDPDQVMEIGLQELWESPGVTVVEWPERLAPWPPHWLWLRFEPGSAPEQRLIQAQAQGAAHQDLWQRSLVQFQGLDLGLDLDWEGSLGQNLPKPETKP